ncbi:GNAT family N-acetyltransferase [Plantactinospora sp. GCM10030261]|uniref:GNAT family N-acetyltransferase n=1 Tax=Plantactinospora sp. GCM10030261 TaxID=3273420 RepID=UPI00361F240F
MSPVLSTARLSLRRPVPADIGAILAIHRDPVACAHNPGDMLATRAEAEERYHRWDEHWRRHGFGYWTVRFHADEDGGALGFCGIKLMRLADREVLNLFYRLDPVAWGDGVATEAATSVVSWALTNRPAYPVIARVRPDNVASARVAARAGLRRAVHLDTMGEDGLDWIFETRWCAGPNERRHDR